MTDNATDERRERFLRGGASPAFVLALMSAVSAGGYAMHGEVISAQEAQRFADQRNRYEALQQHCAERDSDRNFQDIRDLRNRLENKAK